MFLLPISMMDNFDKELFKDKIVLIGSSAEGVFRSSKDTYR